MKTLYSSKCIIYLGGFSRNIEVGELRLFLFVAVFYFQVT